MTQLEFAKKGSLSGSAKEILRQEEITASMLLGNIKEGKAVIPLNKTRKIKHPCAIGKGLSTKINANIGTSPEKSDIDLELKKLKVSIEYGADTVMDLSVGRAIKNTRKEILANSTIPVGTVPIYEACVNAEEKKGNFLNFSAEEILDILQAQAAEGVDFFTIHAGVTRESLRALKKHKRVMGIVSRGGAILARWITQEKKENPFYEYFDKVIDIAYKYDVTLSLGDGLRPGSILDATDPGQISELKVLGKLAQRAQERNVQVIIEGPGHVPLDQIEKNVKIEKKFCHGAPFYVLGPLVTDIACGYDHISAAIGGALAASLGADFLCYVTPSEHLRQPSIEDVKEGIIASKIAAHAADIVKGIKKAILRDKDMSVARQKRDWKKQIALSLDTQKTKKYRLSSKPRLLDACTMCGKYCSMKMMEECLG